MENSTFVPCSLRGRVFGLMLFYNNTDVLLFFWAIEKFILCGAITFVALMCKELQEGSEALAEGNLNYKLDTSHMGLSFKEHGENLNRIGEGISAAVEQRMKSEHLKTELITNVSHDIKTPLTSIINYADLIGKEVEENDAVTGNSLTDPDSEKKQRISEYAEVLLRQSKKLKNCWTICWRLPKPPQAIWKYTRKSAMYRYCCHRRRGNTSSDSLTRSWKLS